MNALAPKDWFSIPELAEHRLPRLPRTVRGLRDHIERCGWMRPEEEGTHWRYKPSGQSVEFHLRALPSDVRAELLLIFPREAANDADDGGREGIWASFDNQSETKKATARERLAALKAVAEIFAQGSTKGDAVQQVADRLGVRRGTIYDWRKLVAGVPEDDWLPHLVPQQTGKSQTEETCPSEAWDFLAADYLRLARPTFAACFRRLERVAAKEGWKIPSAKTLERRIKALPRPMVVAARDGQEALKRLYPAQVRDHSVFRALEAVNADGHKWDVFVKWPDGSVGRPVSVVFQDILSGKILSWRTDRSENRESVRLAFGDVVERFGIPELCWFDNGRNFASKSITGGMKTRYRFKVKDEDPAGIMETLNVKVHWTTPYAGQSKPIERSFRDFAGEIAKIPAFAGAYTGNSPVAKPEDYGSTAIPIDVFEAQIAGEIALFNARTGRRSGACKGRSFDDVFNESYAIGPVRKATVAQRRVWLLASERILVPRKGAAIIKLLGNVYWHDALSDLAGQFVTVRFDPQSLHQPIHVYRADGSYLVEAPCHQAVGFNDVGAAREHASARNAYTKAQNQQLKAERRLSIRDVAQLLPAPAPYEPPPEPRVIRMAHGSLAVEADTDAEDEIPERERLMLAGLRHGRADRARPLMRIVDDEEEDTEADG